ncbi:hypothetical protein [Shinella sp. JR1-6]|uniref:hypothetical protein n=1 Tax=Shinella sp. JR1-6 TaxID=2527671 RepID=UPI00102D5459|nr:hypothetical protein [Shinella sp. JR1-6]TAA49054.1 hypothetical protein EXZ48_34595 [Shinella sp. JR1-6]
MTDLSSLISRVEKATGPDRELDAMVWLEMTPGATRKFTKVKSETDLWPPYTIDETRAADGRLIIVPAYTSSIDAAVALAERVLPGVELEITNLYGVARVTLHHETGQFYGSSAINSLPMALVLATLRALQSKGPEA